MPDYDIYILDESDLTISGGGVLDGVNQGTGEHLLGLDITLNTKDWTPIAISDNDVNFQDNDSSQTLNGAQEIDGITYADGTVVETEYSLTLSDGVNTYLVMGFNVTNGSPSYATVEGLAFIGGPGGFPPVGVPLTVVAFGEGPSNPAADFATPICLTAGTLVETAEGPRAVERIKEGDMVLTRDAGLQPVRWVGRRDVGARGSFAPVEIAAGALGNTEPLLVSQQHRILLEGWRTQLVSGEDAALVAAVHLVNDTGIRLRPGGRVSYVHLMFDDHQVIRSNGIWTESLLPGKGALDSLLPAARAELIAIFPELSSIAAQESCRPCYPLMSRQEAVLMTQGAEHVHS
ncbi:MAG: Hint domain-containing protein [Pseudomonadota bacterium]